MPRRLQNAANTTNGAGGSDASGSNATGAESVIFDALNYALEYKRRFESACDDSGSLIHCVKRLELCSHWDTETGHCVEVSPAVQLGCTQEQLEGGDCPGATKECFVHADDGLTGMPYLLVALLLGCIVSSLLAKLASMRVYGRKINIPFTVVMFLMGFSIDYLSSTDYIITKWSVLHVSVQSWLDTHPHIILFVLLPPLLFEDSVSIDYHTFRKSLGSSILLAGPGVVMNTMMTGLGSSLLFYESSACSSDVSYEKTMFCENIELEADDLCEMFVGCYSNRFSISVHFLLGGILAATDPVAVLAVLKSLGAPEKLNQIIGGESLLNDGTAVVVFWVARDIVAQCHSDVFLVVGRFTIVAFGGVMWGLVAANVTHIWIKHVRHAPVEICIVMTSVFSVFWLAEHALHVSGVLAAVVFGLATARKSYFAMNAETLEKNQIVWEQMGFLTTMILFMLAGIIVRGKIAKVEMTSEDVQQMMLKSLVFYVIVFAVRGAVITVLFPILRKIGYSITNKEAMVMTFGGLRGAVSLALALLVDSHPTIPNRIKDFVLIQTSAVVTLSLLINGTTVGLLYHKLSLYRVNKFTALLVTQTMENQHERMITVAKQKFKTDWFHRYANVDIVLTLMPDFKAAMLRDEELVGVKQTSCREVNWSFDSLHKNQFPITNMGRMEDTEEEKEARRLEIGTSDPYVEVLLNRAGVPGKRKSTPVIKKNLNPVWTSDNAFKYSVENKVDELVVYAHVFDWDLGLTDDYLGQVMVDVTPLLKAAYVVGEDGEIAGSQTEEYELKLANPTDQAAVDLIKAGAEAVRRSDGSSASNSLVAQSSIDSIKEIQLVHRHASPQKAAVGVVVDAVEESVMATLQAAEHVGTDLAKGVWNLTASLEGSLEEMVGLNHGPILQVKGKVQGALKLRCTFHPHTKEEDENEHKHPYIRSYFDMAKTEAVERIGYVQVEVLSASNLRPSDPGVLNEHGIYTGSTGGASNILSHMNKILQSSADHQSGTLSEFDSQNALYQMILQNMLATFRESADNGVIGAVAYNMLEHACGVANDASILAHDMKQVDWQGAIVILWSEIAEYIREGNQTYLGKRVPHLWFAHMITVAEMLFVTCKALQHLGAATFMKGASEGGTMTAHDRIHVEVEVVEASAKTMISEQRVHYPSTYRVVQTILALRGLCCEYRANIKRCYEMGCVTMTMKEHVDAVLDETLIKVNDFFFPGVVQIVKAVLGMHDDNEHSHPAVMCFWRDCQRADASEGAAATPYSTKAIKRASRAGSDRVDIEFDGSQGSSMQILAGNEQDDFQNPLAGPGKETTSIED